MSKLLSPSFLFMDNIFYKKLKLTPSLGVVEAPCIGWADYMHIGSICSRAFYICYLFWMISVRLSGVSAHIMADVVLRHTPAWLHYLIEWIYVNCHMQQSAFGKGNFADSLFHMLFFPCAVIVWYSSLSWIFWGERVLLDLRFVHTPSL